MITYFLPFIYNIVISFKKNIVHKILLYFIAVSSHNLIKYINKNDIYIRNVNTPTKK